MNEKNGINQTYARVYNNKLVLTKLREKEMSGTLIGQELNLSNASVSSIIKDLLEKNIIKISKIESKTNVGRKQVYYTLNEDYGLICVISLSDKKARIVLSNIKEEILEDVQKEFNQYNLVTIYEMILKTKSIIEEKFKDIPLKSIIISIPGRVNDKNGQLQLSKQFDNSLFEGENNILSLFKRYFNCEVKIMNDIVLKSYGERAKGQLQNDKNALLLHIDEGIGSSFILNGKLYRGEDGYAGEIGLFRINDEYLDEIVSLRALREKLKLDSTNELITKYHQDKLIFETCNQSGRILGKLLKDIQEFLNLSKIIITGRVTFFGENYLKLITEEVNKAYKPAEINYSLLSENSDIIGGIYKAVNDLLSEKSEICQPIMANER